MMREQDLSFIDVAPARAEATTAVDATRDEVWKVIADHRGWVEWFGPSLVGCEPTSEATSGVGSTRVVRLRGGARVHERFIAWDEPDLWAFTATSMKPAMFTDLVERIRLDPIGPDRTRITYTMAFAPTRALRPARPLLQRGISRSLQGALDSLARRVVEAR